MNIENKKTTLEDDSILYQKHDRKVSREELASLPLSQKLDYFKDYYLKFVLVGAAILLIAVHLIYQVTHPSVAVLSAAFVNDAVLTDTEGMEAELRSLYDLKSSKETVSLTNYSLEEYQQQIAFTTVTTVGNLDVVICDRDYFDKISENGLPADLSTVLPEDLYSSLVSQDRILSSSQIEYDIEGSIAKEYESLPRGIVLNSDSPYFTYQGSAKQPVLCIMATSKRLDAALTFTEWMCQ
ncbi:MAG: hypothetical protein Q4B01_05370 [Eubacteriales bacterium]|nr:hypothetical protein [Eubacteriales bacterium]